MKEKKSKCCQAPVHVEGGDEGTNYYVCDKCDKACDASQPVEQKEQVGEKNYNHLSHTHCFDQDYPPCNIPLSHHNQCCLCDLKFPVVEDSAMKWGGKLEDLINDIRKDGSTDSVHIHEFVKKIVGVQKQCDDMFYDYIDPYVAEKISQAQTKLLEETLNELKGWVKADPSITGIGLLNILLAKLKK